MSVKEIERLREILFKVLERASEPSATPELILIVPEVAKVLRTI